MVYLNNYIFFSKWKCNICSFESEDMNEVVSHVESHHDYPTEGDELNTTPIGPCGERCAAHEKYGCKGCINN